MEGMVGFVSLPVNSLTSGKFQVSCWTDVPCCFNYKYIVSKLFFIISPFLSSQMFTSCYQPLPEANTVVTHTKNKSCLCVRKVKINWSAGNSVTGIISLFLSWLSISTVYSFLLLHFLVLELLTQIPLQIRCIKAEVIFWLWEEMFVSF